MSSPGKKAFASLSWSGSIVMVDKKGYLYPKAIEYIVFPEYYYNEAGWPCEIKTGKKCEILKK